MFRTIWISIFLIFFIASFSNCNSQIISRFQPNVGLKFSLGTHFSQIGLTSGLSIQLQKLQLNVLSDIHYVFHSFGSREHFWESKTSIGLLVLGGKKSNTPDFILSTLSNNTLYYNSIGYAYIWYLDTKKTSQNSGAWSLGTGPVSIYFENDVFGGFGEDKYRTANFIAMYRKNYWRIFSEFSFWTGDSRGTYWFRDKPAVCPYGYKLLNSQPYGKTSHGIASINFQYSYLNKSSKIALGVDSEEFRHIVQNKIIHDLCWLPKWMPHNTPHYPRLDENGLPVFNKNERRKDKLFYQMDLFLFD